MVNVKNNKLVRDKIPQIIFQKHGKKPLTKILSENEYAKALDEKLKEEVSEYLKSKEIEELADIEEVILAILKSKNVAKKDFEKIRIKKAKDKGKFSKRIRLIKV